MELLQVAQRAEDLDRAADFYTLLFGVPPAARFDPPGLLFFSVGSIRLLIERAGKGALLYFKVDDVRSRIEELRAAGVRIESEPHILFKHQDDTLGPAGTDEWHAFIRDSENNLVGLVSHLAPDTHP
jgi:methylmalonyl-CoA/ethylmalonyl-CoA epimerase